MTRPHVRERQLTLQRDCLALNKPRVDRGHIRIDRDRNTADQVRQKRDCIHAERRVVVDRLPEKEIFHRAHRILAALISAASVGMGKAELLDSARRWLAVYVQLPDRRHRVSVQRQRRTGIFLLIEHNQQQKVVLLLVEVFLKGIVVGVFIETDEQNALEVTFEAVGFSAVIQLLPRFIRHDLHLLGHDLPMLEPADAKQNQREQPQQKKAHDSRAKRTFSNFHAGHPDLPQNAQFFFRLGRTATIIAVPAAKAAAAASSQNGYSGRPVFGEVDVAASAALTRFVLTAKTT